MIRLLLLICLVLGACGSAREVVPVDPSVKMDSVVITRMQHDSVYVRDSVWIRDAADTVYVTKWRVEYRMKMLHDTLYAESIDTIRVPIPVEAKLTAWQKLKVEMGGLAIGAVVIVIMIFGFKFFFRH